MRIHVTAPLFAWDELEDDPSLAVLQQLLGVLPDAQLPAQRRRFRGKGRNDYPVEVLWAVLVLTSAWRHVTIEARLAELQRNAALQRLAGIPSPSPPAAPAHGPKPISAPEHSESAATTRPGPFGPTQLLTMSRSTVDCTHRWTTAACVRSGSSSQAVFLELLGSQP